MDGITNIEVKLISDQQYSQCITRWFMFEHDILKPWVLISIVKGINTLLFCSQGGLGVTPDFLKETKCIPICMPGSSFMHIVTYK
jgi:hypothetical protein